MYLHLLCILCLNDIIYTFTDEITHLFSKKVNRVNLDLHVAFKKEINRREEKSTRREENY